MIALLFGCTSSMESEAEPVAPIIIEEKRPKTDWSKYPFLKMTAGLQSIEEKFPVPNGYQRQSLEPDSFGEWLRHLPLLERNIVYSYQGTRIQAPSAAVVAFDVGKGDVQQCADSILRLYGEYLWSISKADNWSIHFTSGDVSSWNNWKNGERFQISGAKVQTIKTDNIDPSYSQYQKWLHHSFLYAGTRSLPKDAKQVPETAAIQVGDFFVTSGSPGHAIIVLDIATAPNKAPIALLGQGFIPAQEFHVLKHSNPKNENWFVLPQKGEQLVNPSWSPFPRENLYRFE